MLLCNCLWIILLWIFLNFCNSIKTFIANQSNSHFCCFLNGFFWRSFKCICCRLFSIFKKFLNIFTAHAFAYVFIHILNKRQKSIAFCKFLISQLNRIPLHFLYFTLSLITKTLFILSSISRGLKLWSVNHISMCGHSELNVFRNITFFGWNI